MEKTEERSTEVIQLKAGHLRSAHYFGDLTDLAGQLDLVSIGAWTSLGPDRPFRFIVLYKYAPAPLDSGGPCA